jgi:hypothetical protein
MNRSPSLLCEIDTNNGLLTSSSFRQVRFQLLIQGLVPVSLLKSELGFKVVMQLADTAGKR